MNGVGGGETGEGHREDIVVVTTVEGGRVDLPCDIKSPTPGDSVYLVLWYRKDTGTSSKESGTPIYRYSTHLFIVKPLISTTYTT